MLQGTLGKWVYLVTMVVEWVTVRWNMSDRWLLVSHKAGSIINWCMVTTSPSSHNTGLTLVAVQNHIVPSLTIVATITFDRSSLQWPICIVYCQIPRGHCNNDVITTCSSHWKCHCCNWAFGIASPTLLQVSTKIQRESVMPVLKHVSFLSMYQRCLIQPFFTTSNPALIPKEQAAAQ